MTENNIPLKAVPPLKLEISESPKLNVYLVKLVYFVLDTEYLPAKWCSQYTGLQ